MARYLRICGLLFLSRFSAPCVVDSCPDIVYGRALGDVGSQGQQQFDELLFHHQFLRDFRLPVLDVDDDLRQLRCRLALGEPCHVVAEALHIAYVWLQAECIGRKVVVCLDFRIAGICRLAAVEVLHRISGVWENLVVAPVYVYYCF